jgi:hypothetical protein
VCDSLLSISGKLWPVLHKLPLSLQVSLIMSRVPVSVCVCVYPSYELIAVFMAVSGLLMWGALSDEKSNPYFSVFAGHRQRYFIVSIFETPPTWRARFLYLYPPGTGWPSCTLGHWVSTLTISKSHYDRQSVGQSVLVLGAHLRPATNFSFSISFRQLLFVIL